MRAPPHDGIVSRPSEFPRPSDVVWVEKKDSSWCALDDLIATAEASALISMVTTRIQIHAWVTRFHFDWSAPLKAKDGSDDDESTSHPEELDLDIVSDIITLEKEEGGKLRLRNIELTCGTTRALLESSYGVLFEMPYDGWRQRKVMVVVTGGLLPDTSVQNKLPETFPHGERIGSVTLFRTRDSGGSSDEAEEFLGIENITSLKWEKRLIYLG